MSFQFVNARGNTLQLNNNPYFHLVNIDGLTLANSDISSMVIGGIDGDLINNIQAQPRSIIFDFMVREGVEVEQAKREILKIIKLKQKCSLLWTQKDTVKIIHAVVEAVEMPRFSDQVAMQISLHCEQPFWEDITGKVQDVSEAKPLHYFTSIEGDMLYFPAEGIPLGEYDVGRSKLINNTGDVDVGLEIEILAYKLVTNPIIYDQDGNFFGIGYGTGNKQVVMQPGDRIVVSTVKGNKTVKKNGVQSLFGFIKPQSTWLQLEAGTNIFAINSDDDELENMSFSLSFKQRYI